MNRFITRPLNALCQFWLRSDAVTPSTRRKRPLAVEHLEERCGLSVVAGQEWMPPFPVEVQQPSIASDHPSQELQHDKPVAGQRPHEGLPAISAPDTAWPGPLVPGLEAEKTSDVVYQGVETNPLPGAGDPLETTSAPERPLILAKAAAASLVRILSQSTEPSQISRKTDAYFELQRTPVQRHPLPVSYEVTAFTAEGAVSQKHKAIIGSGHASVKVPGLELPLTRQRGVEIVTLTVRQQPSYELGKPGATLFVSGSSQTCSEGALIQAYRRGASSEAFTALVELHRSRVLQTCHAVLGNLADAEDASQLVFMMFAQQQFQLQKTVGRWLQTVARNIAISLLRARQRRLRHEQQAKRSELQSVASAAELREELEQALSSLPRFLRQAVELRYLQGWSQEEAAEKLGCPRGTLSQRAARGLSALRKLMSVEDSELVR